jgi:hypothetical protein
MALDRSHRPSLQRPPFDDPTTHIPTPFAFDPEFKINFRHPAYPDSHNVLMILPGLDHPQGGIHHRTALWACIIVANNRFDGRLTEDRAGKVEVVVPLDGILQKHNYYFQVSEDYQGQDLQYPNSL